MCRDAMIKRRRGERAEASAGASAAAPEEMKQEVD